METRVAVPLRYAGARERLKQVGVTVLICIVIAAILWAVSSSAFVEALWYSLGIGLSVHLLTALATARLPRVPVIAIWVVTLPAGVMSGLFIGSIVNGEPMAEIFANSTPIGSLIIALIVTYVFYSYYSMAELRESLRAREVAQLESDKQLTETQLRLLQSQIEPHFLFNTLSHVISLVRNDPPRAEAMLQQLSQFLRASLRRSRSEYATLADEVALLRDYLEILKVRMGERLHFSFELDVDPKTITLPPLILQPLVENAVVHGLEPAEAGGKIVIRARREDHTMVLEVEDSGPGIDTTSGDGFGLANVRARLARLYGTGAQMEFSDAVPHGLKVRLRIPLEQVT